MVKPKGEVPTRETPEFRQAQTNGQFHSWLRMRDTVTELEFSVRDAPELKEVP